MNTDNCAGKAIVEKHSFTIAAKKVQAIELRDEWLWKLKKDLCCVKIHDKKLVWFKYKSIERDIVITHRESRFTDHSPLLNYQQEIYITIVPREGWNKDFAERWGFEPYKRGTTLHTINGVMIMSNNKNKEYNNGIPYDVALQQICELVAEYNENFDKGVVNDF
jgi:hypothetical protein